MIAPNAECAWSWPPPKGFIKPCPWMTRVWRILKASHIFPMNLMIVKFPRMTTFSAIPWSSKQISIPASPCPMTHSKRLWPWWRTMTSRLASINSERELNGRNSNQSGFPHPDGAASNHPPRQSPTVIPPIFLVKPAARNLIRVKTNPVNRFLRDTPLYLPFHRNNGSEDSRKLWDLKARLQMVVAPK